MTGTTRRSSPVVPRCPACGQPLGENSPTACPLCGFEMGDSRVTGDDVTPYAVTYAQGKPTWWKMCKWVWNAGPGRLKHLALMRSSDASRRFAGLNILFFAFALAFVQGTNRGWQFVITPLDSAGAHRDPAGSGWLKLSNQRFTTSDAIGKRAELWWNPPHAIIAGVAGLVSAFVALHLLRVLFETFTELAHRRAYRKEQRMRAALAYGTAWGVLALPAAVISGLFPFVAWFGIKQPGAFFSDAVLLTIVAVVCGLPAVLWWFWLIRLGGTAPADSRGAVVTMFVVAGPILTIAVALAWWFGLSFVLDRLFTVLRLNF